MSSKKKWEPSPKSVPLMGSLPNANRVPLAFPYGINKNRRIVVGNFKVLSNMLIVGEQEHDNESYVDIILSTLVARNSQDNLKIVLVNTKKTTCESFERYQKLKHLYCPVVNSTVRRNRVFRDLFNEMNNRYDLFDKCNVLHIDEYNHQEAKKLSTIIIVINDYREYINSNIESYYHLVSILTKGRAVGIHMIICANRRAKSFLSPRLMANMPTTVVINSPTVSVRSIDIKAKGAIQLTTTLQINANKLKTHHIQFSGLPDGFFVCNIQLVSRSD